MKIFLALLLLCSQAQAAFESTNFRYLSGHEITAKLASVFSQAFTKGTNLSSCNITDLNAAATGMIVPGSGRSIYKEPTGAFLNWYLPCISDVTEADLLKSAAGNSHSHLGPLAEKSADPLVNLGKPWNQIPANAFTKEDFEKLVRFQVKRLLGPDEVIEEMGFVGSAAELRDELLKIILTETLQGSVELKAVIKKLEIEILTRDEFLIY